MVDINPQNEREYNVDNRNAYKWDNITSADDPVAVKIEGGLYACSVEGTPGGASIEFQFSRSGTTGTFHSLDATNLTFTDQGSYGLRLSRGFILPVRQGGSGTTDLDAYLTPMPDEAA